MFQFKAHREYISCVFSLIVLTFCAGVSLRATPPMPNPPAQLGWGFEVGRANESDVEALLADQLALRQIFGRMSKLGNDILGPARLRNLLGDDSASIDEDIEKFTSQRDKWWKTEVEDRLIRIASNPAASCDEGREVQRIALFVVRQKMMLGMAEEDADISADVINAANTRCHEEALDECNATGRFEHIPQMMLTEQRLSTMLGNSIDDKWVIPVLQECARYEIHYVSTTNINDAFKLSSVIDGRIMIKPKLEGRTGVEVVANLSFEGEVMSGANPFLQKITCSAPGVSITCSPGGESKKSAWAKIDKMTLKSKEFYVDNGQSKQRPVGEDLLELIFSPAMLSSVAVVKPPYGPPQTVPFVEVGATGFYIAHSKSQTEPLKFKFTETKRSGYPILFEFTRAGSDSVGVAASDSTVFQLIHKPDKKPFPSKSATPKREPLKPKLPSSPKPTRPGSPQ